MKNIVLNDCHYEVIENYKNVFNLEELTDKFTDYFETFDYVLGDYSYGKLRLKGFITKIIRNCRNTMIMRKFMNI